MAATRRFTAIITREGDGYSSLCPELDIASQGQSVEEARDNLKEALELFFESASKTEVDGRQDRNVFVTQVEVRPKMKHWKDGLSAGEQEDKLLCACQHIVHDYANLVSSAEMVLTQRHRCRLIDPPINTHIKHAFLLNCRKARDFFLKPPKGDDLVAADYPSGPTCDLPICEDWKQPIDKQLAHLTMARDEKSRDIDLAASEAIYTELRRAWRCFLQRLPEKFNGKFQEKIQSKLREQGFEGLDLT